MIAASPELAARYEDERRAVDLVRSAVAELRAPESLHNSLRTASIRPLPRRRPQISLGLSLSLAVLALAVILVTMLPDGTPVAPSLSQAADIAGRGPTAPAPGVDPAHPTSRLAQAVDDVYFPNWSRTLGWRATGQRSDHLGRRRAVTVYYRWRGRQIAYTILSVPPVDVSGASSARLGGIRLRVTEVSGRRVVTWQRDGHTCVLSGVAVSVTQLERLAAWRPALRD